MRRVNILILILLIIFFCDIPISAIVTADSGTATINENEYYYWQIPLPDGGILSYEIRIINELRVDVFLYDEKNFYKYEHYFTSPEHHIEGSELNTIHATNRVNLPSGTYFLVVDNTNHGIASPPDDGENNPATFYYTVKYSPNSEGIYWWNIILISIIVIIIVIIAVVVLKRWRQ